MRKIKNLRWWIAGLLAAATALNYLDRQNLPVLVTELQKHISITDRQYSDLQSLFLLAYGLMYLGGGRIVDWLGTRAGYAAMILWWSAANLMQGFVSTVFGLGIFRFLLGLGEGGGFPSSAKAVSEWFPAQERSLAFGIFNTGSSLGAVVAPPMIAAIVLFLNWRWVFFITGLMGFSWVLLWLFFYETPDKHKRCTDEEYAYLKERLPSTLDERPRVSWTSLLRYRQVVGLVVAKFLSDAAWYVFIFWLPKYLGDVRHMNIKQIGYYAWIPYAFAGAGSFIGGWASSYLIRRHLTVDRSRKIALGISAAMMPVSLLIVASPTSLAILFFGTAMFGHQAWSTIMQTLAADMFPSRVVGSVAGLLGGAGSFGGMVFSFLVGEILGRTHSYVSVFVIAGLLHPTAFLLILTIVRRIELVIPSPAAPLAQA
ncbi:MAG: MFS transporter [Candidatus Acidiferrales bacterium]|jgi:MFS transporter, ACS family, hexuronate transporter